MRILSIILTLNVAVVIFSAFHLFSKLNKIQKGISTLYNKINCLDDNCNDNLFDIKVDLEKLGRLEIVSANDLARTKKI